MGSRAFCPRPFPEPRRTSAGEVVHSDHEVQIGRTSRSAPLFLRLARLVPLHEHPNPTVERRIKKDAKDRGMRGKLLAGTIPTCLAQPSRGDRRYAATQGGSRRRTQRAPEVERAQTLATRVWAGPWSAPLRAPSAQQIGVDAARHRHGPQAAPQVREAAELRQLERTDRSAKGTAMVTSRQAPGVVAGLNQGPRQGSSAPPRPRCPPRQLTSASVRKGVHPP